SAHKTATVNVAGRSLSQFRGTDFNGDGRSDILWRNVSTGDNAIWTMNGGTVTSNLTLTKVPDQSWKMVGVGDFDGDGKSDILWRYSFNGQNSIWFMN